VPPKRTLIALAGALLVRGCGTCDAHFSLLPAHTPIHYLKEFMLKVIGLYLLARLVAIPTHLLMTITKWFMDLHQLLLAKLARAARAWRYGSIR